MRTAVFALVLLVLLAACSAGSGGGSGGGSGTTPSAGPILEAADAAAAVAARNPLLQGIGPRDPNLIGQGSWWEATPTEAAKPPVPWTVTYTVGWGDCPSGCIDRHTWTYSVGADGAVSLTSETGSPLTDDVIAERLAAIPGSGVVGRVLAGPTCPVERPGDPSCAGRPVVGAKLQFTKPDGTEVSSLTTDASGWYRMPLEPGDYVLTAEPVEGLMGTPGPMPFSVAKDAQALLDVPYDTGIR